MRRNGKVSNLVRKVVSTFELYSQTIRREALDVQYGCRKGRLKSSLLYFKNMVSRVDIACLEPCSTTSLYPY
jgi:hypothetical protein